MTGKKAEDSLIKAEITVNKNMIPGDEETPFVTSGVRIGTPALTTRGMKEDQMIQVVDLIDRVLANPDDDGAVAKVKGAVLELTAQFPLYAGLFEA